MTEECASCHVMGEERIPFVEYGKEIAKPVKYCKKCFLEEVFDSVAEARMRLDYAYMYLDKALRILGK